MGIGLILTLGVILFLWLSPEGEKPKPKRLSKEEMIELNKVQRDQETERIQAYLNRFDLEMQKSETGLRFTITKETENPQEIQVGDLVVYSMAMTNLMGDTFTTCFHQQPCNTLINRDNTIRGLHEGLQLLSLGEKATFIIPSHLAYGLHGKPGEIGAWETLMCKVEILGIEKTEE